MTYNQQNEEYHARNCAITNIRTSLIFVAFCAVEVFLSWRELGKVLPIYSQFNVLRDVFVIVACTQLLQMYRCFQERFVISLVILRYVIALVSAFMPTPMNRVADLVGIGDLTLWVLALIVSLSMLVQSARNPYVKPEHSDKTKVQWRLLILCAFIAASLLLGALMYFVPTR
jgi:hypothetical protein